MHRVETRPLFADVDAMNVVYYGQYLRFFELGRAEMMRSSGRAYVEMAAQGLHLPVTEAHLRYRRPAFYDDLIVIETWLAWLKKASLRFEYRLLRADGGGREQELVSGYTVHGCVTVQGKIAPLPDWVATCLRPHVVEVPQPPAGA
ncbi:MAG: acyl-CoA thioesterase [Desulfarculus sp.]|nr:acyl-CoA thioesterase [Desulfarculus sp.]